MGTRIKFDLRSPFSTTEKTLTFVSVFSVDGGVVRERHCAKNFAAHYYHTLTTDKQHIEKETLPLSGRVSFIDLMFLKLSENVTLYGRVKQLFCLLTPGK